MGLPWFRLYSEFRNDPKIRTMPDNYQIRLVRLFCLRCEAPTHKLSDEEIAYAIDCPPLEIQLVKSEFIRKGFVDARWEVLNWNKRQYVSDSSTERVREFRARRAELTPKQDETFLKRRETVSVTAPEQIQNRTDTETEKKKPTPKASPSSFTLPIWIYPETWKAFEEMRRKIRAPLTDRARQNIIAELQRLSGSNEDVDAILNQSITRGWRGVFPLNGNGANGNGKLSKLEQMRRDDEELFGRSEENRPGVN